MVTVALIGPDGSGKTTIAKRLENTLPLPIKYLYMGVNLDSSNHMLPTTRLIHAIKRACGARPDSAGPSDSRQVRPPPKGALKRVARGFKATLSLVKRLSEEWFRQGLAWYYQRRGYIVLFDRHYFSDFYAYDIARNGQNLPLSRRIHGMILQHFYPKPELVIYLDAPAKVLYARKREGTVELLERRRQEYLQLRPIAKHFVTVDATQPQGDVAREVARIIWDFYKAKLGKPLRVPNVHQ